MKLKDARRSVATIKERANERKLSSAIKLCSVQQTAKAN